MQKLVLLANASSRPLTNCSKSPNKNNHREETQKRVPEGVVAACHNGADSVTISGDAEQVEKFVEELKQEEIFAKMVDSSGIPFHSPQMLKVH